jgi:hypothetical protein
MQEQVWIVFVEIRVPPGALELGRTVAFTNWVTWGESPERAIARVSEVAASYGWCILGCERVEPFDDTLEYDESITELIEDAAENPNAVLYGTFYTYRTQ